MTVLQTVAESFTFLEAKIDISAAYEDVTMDTSLDNHCIVHIETNNTVDSKSEKPMQKYLNMIKQINVKQARITLYCLVSFITSATVKRFLTKFST